MNCPNCNKKCAKSVCFPDAAASNQGWGYWYCMNPKCELPWTRRIGVVK